MNKTIILCCGKAGCPELSIDESNTNVTIKDDDGNVVTMQVSQAKLIGQAIDDLTDHKEEK
mgnify:FL=1